MYLFASAEFTSSDAPGYYLPTSRLEFSDLLVDPIVEDVAAIFIVPVMVSMAGNPPLQIIGQVYGCCEEVPVEYCDESNFKLIPAGKVTQYKTVVMSDSQGE